MSDTRLIRDLEIMIAHIAKHNWFDKRELIALLKLARDKIERGPQEENELQNWWTQQDQDDQYIEEQTNGHE